MSRVKQIFRIMLIVAVTLGTVAGFPVSAGTTSNNKVTAEQTQEQVVAESTTMQEETTSVQEEIVEVEETVSLEQTETGVVAQRAAIDISTFCLKMVKNSLPIWN